MCLYVCACVCFFICECLCECVFARVLIGLQTGLSFFYKNNDEKGGGRF